MLNDYSCVSLAGDFARKKRHRQSAFEFFQAKSNGKITICRHHQFRGLILMHIALSSNGHRHSG